MKNYYLFLLALISSIGLSAQSVELIDYYPSAGVTGAWDIAQFSNGDYLVLGFYQDDITIGGEVYEHTDNIDFFISKYSANDALLWVKTFGGGDIQRGQSIVIDEEDHWYLALGYTSDIAIGGNVVSSNGSGDIGILKYDEDGNLLWSQTYGGEQSDYCYGLYYQDGQLWAVGHFSETVDFGGVSLSSAGSFDQFILKLNPENGSTDWAKGYGGTGIDRLYKVKPSSDGTLWVVGYYSEGWTFGSTNLPEASNLDGFAGKLDANGNAQLAIPFACSGSGQIRYLEIDDNDQVYLSGFLAGTATVFGETYEAGNGTNNEAFLLAVDQAGNLQWLNHSVADYQAYGSGVYSLDGRLFHTFYGGEQVDVYGQYNYAGEVFQDCAFMELNPADGTVLNHIHVQNGGSSYITGMVGDAQKMRAIVIFEDVLDLPNESVGSSGSTSDLAILAYYPEGSSAVVPQAVSVPAISLRYEAGVLHFWGLEGLEAERASMYNMEGQLLKVGTLSNHQWMVGSLPVGGYLVQIETARGIVSQLFQVVK